VTRADRVALVTGAGRGIGACIATRLARDGMRVVVADLDLAAAVSTAETAGPAAVPVELDVRERASFAAAVQLALAELGGLDVLVNNAGDVGRGDIEHIAVERWDTIMAVNVRAPFILMQTAIPSMRARGGGSIINIGSILAYVGEPKLGAYSVSKGALMTLTRNAASLLNRDRIRVNQINVGWTLTEGERRVKREQEGKGEEWIAEAIATRPFGRLLAPADIAYAAAYFASAESECVTGSVLDLEQYPPGAMTNT
jgi:NAD(P)-dependent dehydrogenase (short-subunit alcohol dehydrogenase family)